MEKMDLLRILSVFLSDDIGPSFASAYFDAGIGAVEGEASDLVLATRVLSLLSI